MSVAAALVLLLAAPTANADPTTKARGPCDEARFVQIQPDLGHEVVIQRVQALIRCVEDVYPVPGGVSTALRVAACESGFWPWAVGNGNYGIYQHRAPYWMSRVHTYLRPAWFNEHQWTRLTSDISGAFIARANVIVAIRMAQGGWGPWSCA